MAKPKKSLAELQAWAKRIEREAATGSFKASPKFFRSENGRECCRLQAEIDQINAAIKQLDAEQAREDAHKARITNASQN